MAGIEDIVAADRVAFAANLLRRLSDRMVVECGRWLAAKGLRAPANTASTLMALHKSGPMPITALAGAIGFSHPFTIRLVDALEGLGLAASGCDPLDARRRLVHLTSEGEAEAARMSATRHQLGDAIADLLAEAGSDLLADLDAIGAALDRRPLDRRLLDRENES